MEDTSACVAVRETFPAFITESFRTNIYYARNMKLFEISLALKRNVTNTWVKCKTNLLKAFQENAAGIQRKKLEYIRWKIPARLSQLLKDSR